jgi:DNA-binding NtrC family response regulator
VPRKANLLLIDDDPNTLASLARAFRLAGHEATVCDSALHAAELIRSQHFDLILSDVVMPGKSGLELLEELKKADVQTPIVLISGQANIAMAVKATRLGALDFLEKPLTTDKLLVTVENALRLTRLEEENRELRHRLGKHELVGSGPAMQKLLAQIDLVAASETRICILGETGTGKELVARAIHEKSPRHENAFITLNCAAVPAELIESELFGHEKGAFTGALQRRLGRFELANGGTIFLDEAGELPLDTQVALLRVLQEREFERVGGTQPVKIDVRVIAATNRDLEAAVENGTFRPDLYYRLNVFPIQVPPLRERQDDLLMLLEYFVDRFAQKMGKHFKNIDKRTVELFRSYPWPGNIRELQNVVERSVIVSSDGVFSVDAAWLSKDSRRVSSLQKPEFAVADEDASRDRRIIEDALAGSRGRVSGSNGAAARLGVPPSTLEHRIKKLRIRKSHFKLS